MGPCEVLGVVGTVGDAVGGFSTAAAVYLGVREVNRWREQRHADHRSEIAARALVGIRSACASAHLWASVLSIEASNTPGAGSGKASAYELGRHIPTFLDGLWRTAAEAYVHLDEAEQGIIREALQLLQTLEIYARSWRDSPPEDREAEDVQAARFRSLAAAADMLPKRAEVVLRPIARFEQTHRSRSIVAWLRGLRGSKPPGSERVKRL